MQGYEENTKSLHNDNESATAMMHNNLIIPYAKRKSVEEDLTTLGVDREESLQRQLEDSHQTSNPIGKNLLINH